jgi:hypothetical protein
MRRWVKWIGLGLLTLAFLSLAVVAIASARTKFPGEGMTPAGFRQASAVYVKMHCNGHVGAAGAQHLRQELLR